MPEHTVVPRGRTIRPVPLPPGALEDIRARAHRRRAGRAALVGSAGLTAVVLVAAAVLAGGISDQRDDSLRVVPADGVRQVLPVAPVPPQPSPAAPVTQDAAGPVDAAAPAVAEAAPAQQLPDRAAAAPAEPEPTSEPAGAAPQRRYDPEPLRTNDGIIVLLPECEQVGRGSVDGWCLSTIVDEPNHRLLLTACRARGYGAGRLDWTTSKQVHFEVRNARGRLMWSYHPRVRPEASSEEVPAEGCLGWELAYDLVDEEGRQLPDGEYTMRASSTATSLRGTYREATFVMGDTEPVDAGLRYYQPPEVPQRD